MIFYEKGHYFYRLHDFYNEKTVYVERKEFFEKVACGEISINKICIFNRDTKVIKGL